MVVGGQKKFLKRDREALKDLKNKLAASNSGTVDYSSKPICNERPSSCNDTRILATTLTDPMTDLSSKRTDHGRKFWEGQELRSISYKRRLSMPKLTACGSRSILKNATISEVRLCPCISWASNGQKLGTQKVITRRTAG